MLIFLGILLDLLQLYTELCLGSVPLGRKADIMITETKGRGCGPSIKVIVGASPPLNTVRGNLIIYILSEQAYFRAPGHLARSLGFTHLARVASSDRIAFILNLLT